MRDDGVMVKAKAEVVAAMVAITRLKKAVRMVTGINISMYECIDIRMEDKIDLCGDSQVKVSDW